jgi:hypothetical protein
LDVPCDGVLFIDEGVNIYILRSCYACACSFIDLFHSLEVSALVSLARGACMDRADGTDRLRTRIHAYRYVSVVGYCCIDADTSSRCL